MRGIAVVERHPDAPACALLCIKDGLGLLAVDGDGLLADDITAHLHRLDDVLVMGSVDGGDNDDLRLGFLDHLGKFAAVVGGNRRMSALRGKDGVGILHPLAAHVAEGHQAAALLISCGDRLVEHPGPTTGPDLGIPLLFHGSYSHSFAVCTEVYAQTKQLSLAETQRSLSFFVG
ncbi:hypothetical protein SDC9_122504 [bioreactor metagenome]|uniref:Uncharacterized protein n=1 Tax=bioreactor metagenome TaxID=1076179 RepID=A0A645CF06_9ZZZZ